MVLPLLKQGATAPCLMWGGAVTPSD